MTKRDFEKLFKKSFNKKKIAYSDARKNDSDIRCFKCGEYAGLKKVHRRHKVVCKKNHKYTLITYAAKYAEMIYDILECQVNFKCNIKADL